MGATSKNSGRKTLGIVVLALLMPIVPFVAIGELPGERWLSATDANAGLFALTGAGLLTVDVLLPIPSSIVATLLGSRLGFLPGWMAGWLGLTVGNLIGYWLGRLWPARWAPELPEQPTLLMLLISRPVPILAEAATIAAGAGRASPGRVLVACASGNAIYTGILAANGAALLAGNLTGPGIIAPLLLPVLGWLLWRTFSRKRLHADRKKPTG